MPKPLTGPVPPANDDLKNRPPAEPSAHQLDLEDFYFEGPNLVFTAAYHLKRGTCCGSGCRHCPYGNSA
jgi:hypothetical protein